MMKYAMCPHCGKRLLKGEVGSRVEIECPKCGKVECVVIDKDSLQITEKILAQTNLQNVQRTAN